MFDMVATMMLGPISKWDDKKPDYQYVSDISVHAAERCLIDVEKLAAPFVYKQADKPQIVTIIYTDSYGIAGIRIDLETKDDGLHVKAWEAPKRAMTCLPPKGAATPRKM